MQHRRTRSTWLLMALIAWSAAARADETAPASSAAQTAAPRVDLVGEQQAILKDYGGFEKRLAEIGEAMRSTDLDRANLLIQARSESQRNQINARMGEIVAILSDQRPYADAVERQKAVVEHLEAILKILQTDAERDRLKARIKELEEILKDTNRLIAAQKDVRADTERGGDFKDLERKEEDVKDAAGDLADKIDAQDTRRAAENGSQGDQSRSGKPGENGEPKDGSEPSPGEGDEEKNPDGSPREPGEAGMPPSEQSPEGQQSSGQPSQGEQSQGQQSQGEQSQGQQSQGQQSQGQQSQGQQSQGQQSQGQQSQGQQSQGQQSQQPGSQPQGQTPQPQDQSQSERTPGREELEQARQQMEQAIQELRAQNRDGASDEQDRAIARLEAMKAQIEEILRQLREEEREMYLTMLEARFQEMLRLQLRINADTVRLDARPMTERGEAHFTKSRDLSQQEQQNILAAEKALTLLKEEGSSVAFPEAVDQMKSNMQTVAGRLFKGDTGDTTQLVEKLIVETLEEMIFSLQMELEKIRDQQRQQQQQQGEQEDPPLVDTLAELKMVRSLQNQVNRLTRQIGLDIEGEQAEDFDTLQLLEDLSRRQQRIQEATYDLATGRNR